MPGPWPFGLVLITDSGAAKGQEGITKNYEVLCYGSAIPNFCVTTGQQADHHW